MTGLRNDMEARGTRMDDAVTPLKIAIVAMGGQGGGVLANWLIEVAERSGCLAQSTAVPGVAQRTGATVYYLEVLPRSETTEGSAVLALMPVPGHVDVVVAGELAEAGRAVLRGLVTPQRTTVIVSTHRDYTVGEKSVVGDGRVDSERLAYLVGGNAKRFIGFDMATLAEQTDSVISSVLLGAIAAADVPPFGKEACQEVIGAKGVAVAANLNGFAAGYECARVSAEDEAESAEAAEAAEPARRIRVTNKNVRALLDRVHADFPVETREVVLAALRRLVDYQDVKHADAYLRRLRPVLEKDSADREYRLTVETARYLALAMTYEDVIRVADLKTRSARFTRVREEVQSEAAQVVALEEFMHPRVQEVCDVMPAWAGSLCMNSSVLKNLIGFFCKKGRRIKTTSLAGFLLLYLIAGLRPFRRGTLRYKTEIAGVEEWLSIVTGIAIADYDLAVEVAECRRLVKGYGETHARGLANFNRIMMALPAIRARPEAAASAKALREAALADGDGEVFEAALHKVV